MTYVEFPAAPGRHAWRQELHDRAVLAGWRVRMLGAEWEPDMLLVRRPRLLWIFAEPDRGRLSAPRFDRFVELRTCRQEAYVWHPSDIEKIGRILI